MPRLRTVSLSAFAVVAFTSYFVSGASAIKFEWSVQGTRLAAGTTLPVIIKPEGTIILKGKAFNVETELETSTFKETGANIQGGVPGTGEGVRTYENITVVKPKGCGVENIKLANVAARIVEGASGGVGNGRALVLLKPANGSVFAKFEYKSKKGEECALEKDVVNITGSVLLEPLSTTEKPLQLWTYRPPGNESISSSGTHAVNNLELSGGGKFTAATISGTVGVLLEDDLPFSAL